MAPILMFGLELEVESVFTFKVTKLNTAQAYICRTVNACILKANINGKIHYDSLDCLSHNAHCSGHEKYKR